MTLVTFSPLRVENEYADWRERLAQANNPAFLPIEFIDQRIHEGTAFFHGTTEAALVVEFIHWPGGARTVSVIAAAGDKDEILGRLGEDAMRLGREMGATHAMVPGRDGWRRARPDFSHYQTILVKEL
jgi:hypothetical protein